jgi:hypothetical protein
MLMIEHFCSPVRAENLSAEDIEQWAGLERSGCSVPASPVFRITTCPFRFTKPTLVVPSKVTCCEAWKHAGPGFLMSAGQQTDDRTV